MATFFCGSDSDLKPYITKFSPYKHVDTSFWEEFRIKKSFNPGKECGNLRRYVF